MSTDEVMNRSFIQELNWIEELNVLSLSNSFLILAPIIPLRASLNKIMDFSGLNAVENIKVHKTKKIICYRHRFLDILMLNFINCDLKYAIRWYANHQYPFLPNMCWHVREVHKCSGNKINDGWFSCTVAASLTASFIILELFMQAHCLSWLTETHKHNRAIINGTSATFAFLLITG